MGSQFELEPSNTKQKYQTCDRDKADSRCLVQWKMPII